MSLLVSIHDVTPAFAEPVRALWKLCRENGATPALLVVPNWHGEWPLEQHPEFVKWIRDCAAHGAEIFLHGERHDEVGLPRSVSDSLRAFGRTAREGEFLTLDEAAATARIQRGLALFVQLGLNPIGFVPPAWLAREGTFDAVKKCGLKISEDEGGIRIHARNSRVNAPAIRWSGRTPFRAKASAAVASWRWQRQRSKPLMRLALHPQDLNSPTTEKSVHQETRRWLALGNVIRYGDV
ncbi:MAG: polysaccharide deacetylase family protein [Gemmatimonadaceae bacterium]